MRTRGFRNLGKNEENPSVIVIFKGFQNRYEQCLTKIYKMKFLKAYWFYILAALITIIGIVTGWYLFIFLVIPFGFFNFGRKDKEE